jgi:hypothetical protein
MTLLSKLKKLIEGHEPKRHHAKKTAHKKASGKKKMPKALREYREKKRR